MNKGFGINVGGSSVLMIFVLLCLVTFSTLSVVSANADYKLTKKAAQSVTRYYEADAQAEMILATIDQTLKDTAEAASDDIERSAYDQLISDALADRKDISVQLEEDQMTIQYQIKMDDRRALQVALQPVYPLKDTQKRYLLTAWQVIQTAEWEPDDTINVWDGENPLPLWNGEI